MLKKKHRLNLSNPQNLSILERANSKFISSKFFNVFFRDNQKDLKLAVVVPKKVVPKAVFRNFYKRRLYLLIEENLKRIDPKFLEIKQDFVLILKKNAKLSQDKKENSLNFEKEIKEILNKVF